MLYNICAFFFFYIFPHWKVDADLETKWLLIYWINEFANRLVSDFFSSFLGRFTLNAFF